MAFIALVLACAPLAVAGLVVAAVSARDDRQWTSGWKPVFRMGFVIQVSSVGVTAPIALLLVTFISLGDFRDFLAGSFCFVSATAGSLALPAWRRLIAASAPETPISIR